MAVGTVQKSTSTMVLVRGVSKNPRVAHVYLKGPSRLNLMTQAFTRDLRSCIDVLDADTSIGCCVLQAAPPATSQDKPFHFCAGIDLKEAASIFFQHVSTTTKLKAAAASSVEATTGVRLDVAVSDGVGMPAMRAQHLHALIEQMQQATNGIAKCRVPIIAAISGSCIGGGVDVAAACDFRLCSKDAVFSVKEAAVAITADLGTLQRLGRLCGEGNARELALTARNFSSAHAKDIGFVNTVLDDYVALSAHATAVADEIASNSPLAVQGTKVVLEHAFAGHTVEEGLTFVRMWNAAYLKSDDLVEAVKSFATKAPPQYSDHVVPPSSGVK